VDRNQLQTAMARLAEGDRRMLRPVFDGLHPLVQRWCRRLLRNDADAEDATQVTLEKLFFRVSDFDPRGDALGWALALATAECRTIARKQFRRRETSDAVLASHFLESEAERSLLHEEMTHALTDVLGTLKPEDLQTLLAWVEVTPRPAVPATTFRKRLERAVHRLRAAWRGRYGLD
jgi:RNA polymerase sigma factor (sigma-70 family)